MSAACRLALTPCSVWLTRDVFQHPENLALRRHPLDVRVVLQGQQAAGRGLSDVDQLKVAGKVGGWVLPGDDVPLQGSVAGVPQGAADVQTACFGWEIPGKTNDVLCSDKEEEGGGGWRQKIAKVHSSVVLQIECLYLNVLVLELHDLKSRLKSELISKQQDFSIFIQRVASHLSTMNFFPSEIFSSAYKNAAQLLLLTPWTFTRCLNTLIYVIHLEPFNYFALLSVCEV